MKTLIYSRRHRLGKLHDELVAAIPSLAPIPDGEFSRAVMTLGGDGRLGGTTIEIVVPDDTDEQAVAAVVAAHDGTTPGPAEQEQITSDKNKRTIEESLTDRMALLRTSLDAITSNPPTLLTGLSPAERRIIRDLLRQSMELTRLTRQMFDSTA